MKNSSTSSRGGLDASLIEMWAAISISIASTPHLKTKNHAMDDVICAVAKTVSISSDVSQLRAFDATQYQDDREHASNNTHAQKTVRQGVKMCISRVSGSLR